jgi:putative PIN family toxin of toxin-antitoxin system
LPLKKDRIPVVFDTSLFITRFIKHKRHGANRRVIDLWQERRKLQLVLSQSLQGEYLYVLENYVGISETRLQLLKTRLENASYVSRVNVGKRFYLSRDPKDNMLLDTAHAGNAKFLVTRDKDLLEIPESDLWHAGFEVVAPLDFLRKIGESYI